MIETSGIIQHTIDGDTVETWYTVVGDLKSSPRPLIILHGGPGFSHSYVLPHIELASARGIPVIFYDQLGCGQSSHPRKPKEFWTFDVFMGQLEAVLAYFEVKDDYSLLGHAWGGMIASSFVISRRPPGVKRLVVTNCPSSMELWQIGTNSLLALFPEEMRAVIKKHELAGTTNDKEYQDAMQIFNETHMCTVKPWPKEVLKSFEDLEKDPTLYLAMNGPSEFNITGSIKSWSIVDDLHTVACPTLVINGRHDEAQDIAVSPFFEKIPKVKWLQLAESTHMPFWEEPVRYFKVVGDFLLSSA